MSYVVRDAGGKIQMYPVQLCSYASHSNKLSDYGEQAPLPIGFLVYQDFMGSSICMGTWKVCKCQEMSFVSGVIR